jgi:hypothetical protein
VIQTLWAKAAGRCEFRGCNELLYRDDLTKRASNLAIIAHIVAQTPDGPRGDEIRSPLLATDIRNLMLVCQVHGKIIDDHDKVDEYPEALLMEFKKEHEDRVRRLTQSTEEAQTHVLLLQASIDERDVRIDEKAAFKAIQPRYPAEETARLIDLSTVPVHPGTDGYFPVMSTAIDRELRGVLERRAGSSPIKTLSVFALAPVPLLVHLGHQLGDIEHVELYQRHRDLQDWCWKAEEEAEEFYEVSTPSEAGDTSAPVAMVLSISQKVKPTQVARLLGPDTVIFEVCAREPGLDFLRSKKRLEIFSYEVRKLLRDIDQLFGRSRTLHVIAAVPPSVAVEFGRSIQKYHPPIHVYEYDKPTGTYRRGLDINTRQP